MIYQKTSISESNKVLLRIPIKDREKKVNLSIFLNIKKKKILLKTNHFLGENTKYQLRINLEKKNKTKKDVYPKTQNSNYQYHITFDMSLP